MDRFIAYHPVSKNATTSDNLMLVREILELEGMTVHCAGSGEEAVSQIESRDFLLMITDLNMPGLNGLELARKALEIAPRMPIILSTGAITPEIPRQAAEAGISLVLEKPFHPDEMLEAVKSVVGNIRIRASLAAG
jgi:CheY-like chemotaxis protein